MVTHTGNLVRINPRKFWKLSVLSVLYELLVSEFGRHETWEHRTTPGHGKDARYKQFLKQFAGLVGAESAGAVAQQIAFAITNREVQSLHSKPLARTAVLNLAAAYEAGFIRAKDIPGFQTTRAA